MTLKLDKSKDVLLVNKDGYISYIDSLFSEKNKIPNVR